jgi:hypothetical protein
MQQSRPLTDDERRKKVFEMKMQLAAFNLDEHSEISDIYKHMNAFIINGDDYINIIKVPKINRAIEIALVNSTSESCEINFRILHISNV